MEESQETQSLLLESTGKIIRRSIYTFLKFYQYFTTTPVLLCFPFSASILFLQALFQSSSPLFHFQSFTHFGRFSLFSQITYTSDANNISQTNLNLVFISLPFAITSYVITKAAIIQSLNHQKPSSWQPFFSSISLFKPLLVTHLCSLVLIITINTATFSLLFIALDYLKAIGFLSYTRIIRLSSPAARAVFYSLMANVVIVSNLALVVAEGRGACTGYAAITKACKLLRSGKNSMAFLLILPTNLGFASVEALFRYRVIRVYHFDGRVKASMAIEGLLIVYMYSLLIVLDTIVCCLFYKSFELNSMENQSDCDIEVTVQEKEILEEVP